MRQSYYNDLGLDDYANFDVVKAAYRKLAMKWHPDRNKSEQSHEIFLKIQTAYEFLKNPEHKQYYDAWLRSAQHRNTASPDNTSNYFDENGWVHQAKQKAQSYANMPYGEFAKAVKIKAKNVAIKILSITASLIGVGIAIVIGQAAGVVSQVQTNSYLNAKKEPLRQDLQAFMIEEVKRQKKTLPRMLDDSLRLDDIRVDGAVFTSIHTTVNFSATEIDKNHLIRVVRENNKTSLCRVASEAFKLDFMYVYSYYGRLGNHIADIKTTRKTCGL